jgi:hypothetical protein
MPRPRPRGGCPEGAVARSGSATPQASVDDRPPPAEEPTISLRGASLKDFSSITEEVWHERTNPR